MWRSIVLARYRYWPISLALLMGCTVAPPKPYVSTVADPVAPTYILVPGWLWDWKPALASDDGSDHLTCSESSLALLRRGDKAQMEPVSALSTDFSHASAASEGGDLVTV